ncbi:uncharacterized protein [Rhodnius prolixus]|uniref:uncharacterized protein n=1 Tax=Rhodnius prolixus TaxID=13249 RepID=UPI003D18A871
MGRDVFLRYYIITYNPFHYFQGSFYTSSKYDLIYESIDLHALTGWITERCSLQDEPEAKINALFRVFMTSMRKLNLYSKIDRWLNHAKKCESEETKATLSTSEK